MMKACRVCGRLYAEDAGYCPADGQALCAVSEAPVPADPHDPRIGELLLERYHIRRRVADGGTGRVYEALDTRLDRHVAVKILRPDVARDPVAVERFRREFEVSTQLESPHVAAVLAFCETHEGTRALIMEFLHGEELRATLSREVVLTPARVIRLLSQIGLALDEAHAKALVHRDLKPDNLLLSQTADGDRVKILDFGSVRNNAVDAKKLTVLGTTIGSPFYMAPEQAQGLPSLDRRADVWSLGAITYECLTGELPFAAASGPSLLLAILLQEPLAASTAAAHRGVSLPTSVDPVLQRALSKSVERRTASAGQLADELGWAYGLDDDHRQWATTPEAELDARIAARGSSSLRRPHRPRLPARSSTATAAAYVESLEAISSSTPATGWSEVADARAGAVEATPVSHAPTAPPRAPVAVGAPRAPLGTPTRASGVPWLAVVVVAVVALMTGVLLVLVLA